MRINRRRNKWTMSATFSKRNSISFDNDSGRVPLKTNTRTGHVFHGFQDFCSNTSMHGWFFLGSPTTSKAQKVFWLLVILSSAGIAVYLLQDTLDSFTSTTTKINIHDRSADLLEAYFPSVVVCNINPLRKSFIYWIHAQLKVAGRSDVSIKRVFDLFGNQFLDASNKTISQEDLSLLNFIFDSDFFEKYFRDFWAEISKKTIENLSKTDVFLYNSGLEEAEKEFGPYNNKTKRIYHENFWNELAGQWKIGQMIPYIMWNGMDPTDPDNRTGVYFQNGYGTSYGVCSWISPFYRMPKLGFETDLGYLPKGALNGENNGLSILLDAETYDYGNGFYDLGERAGEGFKIGIVHPLDMPIIQQFGINVNPGCLYSFLKTLDVMFILISTPIMS